LAGSRPGSKVWNGLYYQINKESTLLLPSHNTAIIATKPLDTMSGNWIEMKKGELIIFHKGLPHTIGNHDNNITLNVKQQHINNTCSSNSANDNNNNIRMMSDLVVQEVYSKHNKDDFSQEVTVFWYEILCVYIGVSMYAHISCIFDLAKMLIIKFVNK